MCQVKTYDRDERVSINSDTDSRLTDSGSGTPQPDNTTPREHPGRLHGPTTSSQAPPKNPALLSLSSSLPRSSSLSFPPRPESSCLPIAPPRNTSFEGMRIRGWQSGLPVREEGIDSGPSVRAIGVGKVRHGVRPGDAGERLESCAVAAHLSVYRNVRIIGVVTAETITCDPWRWSCPGRRHGTGRGESVGGCYQCGHQNAEANGSLMIHTTIVSRGGGTGPTAGGGVQRDEKRPSHPLGHR